jgi:hypothetical protein
MNSARILELETKKEEATEFLQTCARVMQADIANGNTAAPMAGDFVKEALHAVQNLEAAIIKEKSRG